MEPLQRAHAYMEIFYSGEALHRLHGLLFQFDNATDYVDSLQTSPPLDYEFHIIHSYENADSACLVYGFNKPGVLP